MRSALLIVMVTNRASEPRPHRRTVAPLSDRPSAQPLLLEPNEVGIHNCSVARHQKRVQPGRREQHVQRRRPRRDVRMRIDGWIAGFLDQVSAEDHSASTGNHDDEVMVGMPRSGPTTAHRPDYGITC